MHLTSHERSIHESHEAARERQAEGAQADVSCEYCEAELYEEHAHVLAGETFCSTCALDEVARLRVATTWSSLTPAQRLEVWEVLGAVANRLEYELRAELRMKAVR